MTVAIETHFDGIRVPAALVGRALQSSVDIVQGAAEVSLESLFVTGSTLGADDAKKRSDVIGRPPDNHGRV